MALVLANRVQETSTTTGTGTLTLAGAVLGYQTFSAGIGVGNTCYYAITSGTGAWEVGIGTVGTGTLARTTLLSSSTGSLVSFTGTLNVFVTYPSEKSVYSDSTTIVAPTGALLPITSGGTGASTAAAARTALGLGTIATQAANSVAITGGAIDGTTVGSTTAAAGSFTTLNSSGATRLGGLSGNQSLQVNNVASAVNYAQVVGAVTGGSPTLSALGTDANIGLSLASKGTSGVTIDSTTATNFLTMNDGATTRFSFVRDAAGSGSVIKINSGIASIVTTDSSTGTLSFKTNTTQEQVRISPTASAVNYLQLTGAATGAAPTISAQGSDANISLNYDAKGTGSHIFRAQGGANAFLAGASAGAVDYFYTSAGIGFPFFAVAGASANIGFTIASKGTGSFFFKTGASETQLRIGATASAVNYLNATGAVTTGAPELSVQGSDANINLKLTAKGTGGISHTGTAFSPNINLTDAATIAWDTTTAGSQVATFTFVSSNRTMGAPTGLINGAFYALAVIQNAGSNTLTWSSVFKWAAGTAPTLSTAAGAKDYFTFRSDGTSLFQQGISQAVA